MRIIGGGLAGCEAAWQLARRGVGVDLYEMRPLREDRSPRRPASRRAGLLELVPQRLARPRRPGLLKDEMRRLGSLVMRVADAHRVPAGAALAVDRERFRRAHDARRSRQLPTVRIIRAGSSTRFPTTASSSSPPDRSLRRRCRSALRRCLGEEHLYFYDAIAPIVTAESIDMTVAYRAVALRQGRRRLPELPLTREEY